MIVEIRAHFGKVRVGKTDLKYCARTAFSATLFKCGVTPLLRYAGLKPSKETKITVLPKLCDPLLNWMSRGASCGWSGATSVDRPFKTIVKGNSKKHKPNREKRLKEN